METLLAFLVLFLLRITLAFEFLVEPLNTTGIEGTIAELPCTAMTDQFGVGPNFSYWVRHIGDGQLLVLSENGDTSIYERRHGPLRGRLSIISSSPLEYRLQISDLRLDDAGYYQCWHLNRNNFSHYASKGYLSVLPRRTEDWFPRCTIDLGTGPSAMDITVGSTVVFTCRPPRGLRLPSDVGLSVRDPRGGNPSATIWSCENVPCSFPYTLKLSDRNSRLVCGTRIRSNVFDEECTGSLLPERAEVYIVSRPSVLNLNSKGTFFCWTAESNSGYRYQWFIGEKNISGLRGDKEFSFPYVHAGLNNSEITCVVNDVQGYVGSMAMRIYVAMATNNDMGNSPGQDFGDVEDGVGGVATDVPTGEVVNEEVPSGNKMFGIPVEILVFFLCAILVLLVVLIIIILLVYRQKTRYIGNLEHKHGHVIYQQDPAGVKVGVNGDVRSASYRPLPSIGSQNSDNPRTESLYDNINEYHQERVHHSATLPYNSNNAKGIGVSPNSVKGRSNPALNSNDYNLGTDYSVLDPRRASNDTLDSIDIEELHERTRDPSPMRGKSMSVSTNPSRPEVSSGRSRLASSPAGKQNTLYAVTTLIRHDNLDNIAIYDADVNSAPIRPNEHSRQGTESDYASPCNRPKSCDESGFGIGHVGVRTDDVSGLPNSSQSDDGVVVSGCTKDGAAKMVTLDDKKYIMKQKPSTGQCVNGRM